MKAGRSLCVSPESPFANNVDRSGEDRIIRHLARSNDRPLTMPITVSCPKGNKQLKVRDDLVGKKPRCPGCGNSILPKDTAEAKIATVLRASKAAAAKQ